MIDLQFSSDIGTQAERAAVKRQLSLVRVQRWVSYALVQAHPGDEITLRVVGEAEGRLLNRRFRGKGKDYATNVLTFDYQREPFLIADIVLCAPVIAREAMVQRKTLQAHWAHLIVHGVLHAQGYDHERNEREALEMEALEVLLLRSLGYPNPY